MNAHDTPSGTRMMWKARVNAICERAHGTGFTAALTVARPVNASPTITAAPSLCVVACPTLCDDGPGGITPRG